MEFGYVLIKNVQDLIKPMALSEKYIKFDIQHLSETEKIIGSEMFLTEDDLESY